MNGKTAERLLYTMGSCGTSSINYALQISGYPAFSAHWLQHDRSQSVAEFPALNVDLVHRIKTRTGLPLKVIVPIREPVARNVAAYWRVLQSRNIMSPDRLKVCDTTCVQKMFIYNYNMNYPDQWFQLELMDLFGFNPFELEFDHDLGYSIYDVDDHKILIIRLENCDERLHEALYKLLGVKNIHMQEMNTYEGKKWKNSHGDYGIKRYKEFKATPLPRDFVNKHYDLDYAQHFWTDEERRELVGKWTTICEKD